MGIQCPDFPVYTYTGNIDEGFYNNDYYDDGDFNECYEDQTYEDNYGYASWGTRRRPCLYALANISTFR